MQNVACLVPWLVVVHAWLGVALVRNDEDTVPEKRRDSVFTVKPGNLVDCCSWALVKSLSIFSLHF